MCPPTPIAGPLRARDHDGGVPADPGAVAALERLVAGEVGLVVHRDGVDVGRVERGRDGHVPLSRVPQHAQQHVARARAALLVDESVEGLHPLAGLVRVDVRHLAEQATDERSCLVDRSHQRSLPLVRAHEPGRHRRRIWPDPAGARRCGRRRRVRVVDPFSDPAGPKVTPSTRNRHVTSVTVARGRRVARRRDTVIRAGLACARPGAVG